MTEMNELDDHMRIAATRVRSKAEAGAALRVAGMSYADIAFTLEYASEDNARKAIEKALAKGVSAGEKAEHRELAALRYERLLMAVYPVAIDPTNPDFIPAQTKARDLVDRLVALHGAAAPQELVVRNPAATEIAGWIAKVMKEGAPEVEETNPFDAPAELTDGQPRIIDADVVDGQG